MPTRDHAHRDDSLLNRPDGDGGWFRDRGRFRLPGWRRRLGWRPSGGWTDSLVRPGWTEADVVAPGRTNVAEITPDRRPIAPSGAGSLPAVTSISGRLRFRLLPAMLTALGVALLAGGLMSYTTAVEPPPVARDMASYEPLPTYGGGVYLPGGGGSEAGPSFPPGRVATRIVIRRLNIDLPVMLQTDNYGIYPLCDVALYQPLLGQPGQGRATYIYAHAQAGMFLPLLQQSERNNGQRMIGMTVEVYTSDDWLFLYTITEVRRHTRTMQDAIDADTERLWMQTSEGPEGTIPKLQVVADFLSAERTDPKSAHPEAHPRICGVIR